MMGWAPQGQDDVGEGGVWQRQLLRIRDNGSPRCSTAGLRDVVVDARRGRGHVLSVDSLWWREVVRMDALRYCSEAAGCVVDDGVLV